MDDRYSSNKIIWYQSVHIIDHPRNTHVQFNKNCYFWPKYKHVSRLLDVVSCLTIYKQARCGEKPVTRKAITGTRKDQEIIKNKSQKEKL